jgi:hypothetical protein
VNVCSESVSWFSNCWYSTSSFSMLIWRLCWLSSLKSSTEMFEQSSESESVLESESEKNSWNTFQRYKCKQNRENTSSVLIIIWI